MTELLDIARDDTLDFDEKIVRVAELLFPTPEHGVPEAVDFFAVAKKPEDAQPVADYVGILSDAVDAKERMLQHALTERHDKRETVVRPLRSVSEATVDRAIAAYLEDPHGPGTYQLAYEAGLFFPHLLRRHRARLDSELLSKLVLPGASDELTAELEDAYRRTHDEEVLRELAVVRTDRARTALIELRPDVPDDDQETLDLCLEVCGVFPDTREASVYFDSHRGFVVTREESPHHMGEGWEGPRPQCPVCSTPCTRLVTLSAAKLPFELGMDPTLFWFSCECEALSYLYTHATDDGLKGLMVEMTDRTPDEPIVPDAPSLLLERHPNQYGYGDSAPWGYGNHQVGGYTPWIELDRHPRCPLCGEGMRFLAAIDSGATPLGRTRFSGMLHGFWCESDSVACTTLQEDEL